MLMVMLAGAAAAAQSITVQGTASYRPSCSNSRCTDGLQMAAFDAENVVICYTVVDQFPACTLAAFQGASGTEVQLAATSSSAYAEVAVSALDSPGCCLLPEQHRRVLQATHTDRRDGGPSSATRAADSHW